jgi:thiol-disulfide isomerase/thioredoxin
MKIIIKNNSIVKELGFEDFEEITKSDKPYVIKFTSTTCHLCKALKPIFEQIAEQYKNQFKFGNINSSTQRKLFSMFGIDGVPEIFIIDNGDVINLPYPTQNPDKKSGYSKDYIIKNLESYYETRKTC